MNPRIPSEAREEASRKVTIPDGPSLYTNNRAFHRLLTDGVDVEYQDGEGRIVGDKVWLLDFDNPENNDWLAVNQFTVIEDEHNRRPDVVVFVNGLPLIVIELKNPTDEQATIWSAFHQLQTYKHEIPSLFAFNEILIISDGIEARVGSLTADKEWFMPWRTVEGEDVAPTSMPQLQVLLAGLLNKKRLLNYLRNFIVFEDDDGALTKKIAGYHQFHAVQQRLRRRSRLQDPTGIGAVV